MRPKTTYLFSLVLLASACDPTATEPRLEVPKPQIVAWDSIAQPFPEGTYFLFGAGLKDGPRAVLEALLEEGFAVRDAYYPHTWLCAAVFLDQLVVVLRAPDVRAKEFGFTTDPSGFAGGCFGNWEHYDFDR